MGRAGLSLIIITCSLGNVTIFLALFVLSLSFNACMNAYRSFLTSRGKGGFGGGVQFSKRLDFCCYQADSFRSWKTLFVSEKPCHLRRIASDEDEHKVVPVDCVLEKILYLSGNPSHTCVSTAPNFCGHCRWVVAVD